MSRKLSVAALGAALLLAAPAARAQFTPGVPMRRRPATATARDTSGRKQAVRDTIPRVRLSDLKAWVDSVTQYAPATLPAPPTAAPATTPTPAPRKASPARRTPAARASTR